MPFFAVGSILNGIVAIDIAAIIFVVLMMSIRTISQLTMKRVGEFVDKN